MNDTPSRPARLSSSLRTADGLGIAHIEARFDSDIDALWSALVDPQQLARWLGRFDGDLRLSGQFSARFFASEWEGSGRVDVCDPPRRLRVQMTETGASDVHAMELALTAAAAQQTVLVVEERGIPRDQLAAYGAGLQVHVEDLAAYLAGADRCDAQARWAELFPSFQALSIDVV